MMMADWMLGISIMFWANQAMARRYCETALKLEPIQNSSLTRCGYDHRIRALVIVGSFHIWLQGYASPLFSRNRTSLDPIGMSVRATKPEVVVSPTDFTAVT